MLMQLAVAGATGALMVFHVLGLRVLFGIIQSVREKTPLKESVTKHVRGIKDWVMLIYAVLLSALLLLGFLAGIMHG